MAWADGRLDARERQAILDHVPNAGVASGSTAHALLEAWRERRPDSMLLDAWTELIKGICAQLAPDEAARLQADLLQRARMVARASGGVLGTGSKVSSAEGAVLAQLEAAFASRH